MNAFLLSKRLHQSAKPIATEKYILDFTKFDRRISDMDASTQLALMCTLLKNIGGVSVVEMTRKTSKFTWRITTLTNQHCTVVIKFRDYKRSKRLAGISVSYSYENAASKKGGSR